MLATKINILSHQQNVFSAAYQSAVLECPLRDTGFFCCNKDHSMHSSKKVKIGPKKVHKWEVQVK